MARDCPQVASNKQSKTSSRAKDDKYCHLYTLTHPRSHPMHHTHLYDCDSCEIPHFSPRCKLCVRAHQLLDEWLQHRLSRTSHSPHSTQPHFCTHTPNSYRRGPHEEVAEIGWLARMTHPHTTISAVPELVLF